MKTAVMQPYFLPYIGYFQLMDAVDQFVVLDDVNYINRGWINRNRILLNNKPKLFTLPTAGASQNRLINEIALSSDNRKTRKQMDMIYHAYKDAPFFEDVFGMIKEIFLCQEKNLSRFIIHSLKTINAYLDIDTNLQISSQMTKNRGLRAQERILEICRRTGTTHYINPIGGTGLYRQESFEEYGIRLSFLKTAEIVYRQYGKAFVPNLSILDVLMFNSKAECKALLRRYSLLSYTECVEKGFI